MAEKNKKLKIYRKIQANPALAIFQALQDFKQKIDDYLEKAEKRLTEQIRAKIDNMKAEVDPNMEKLVRNILKDIKGEKGDKGEFIKGDKGDKGDSIKGDKGDSIKGDKGDAIVGPMGPVGKSIKGDTGKIPIAGIDYFTKRDIEQFLGKLKGLFNLNYINKELKDIRKILDDMKKDSKKFGGRQSVLHRGGISLGMGVLVGIGNGVTTQFTLPFSPNKPSELVLTVGGGMRFVTDDFTLSGKIITFIIAPPDGAKIRAFGEKN